MQYVLLLLVLIFMLKNLSMSGKNLKNLCHSWKYPYSFTHHFLPDLPFKNYLSFISDAETIDSQGTDGSANSLMKLEANEDMNYVERIKEERSIFNEILENFFQEPDFNQKLKQFKETIDGIFHILFFQSFS